ncbi:hypothetical protein V8E54_004453 [Elaphomyces granulatus]
MFLVSNFQVFLLIDQSFELGTCTFQHTGGAQQEVIDLSDSPPTTTSSTAVLRSLPQPSHALDIAELDDTEEKRFRKLKYYRASTPGGQQHNVFVEDGLVVLATRYHKGSASSVNMHTCG